VLVAQNGLPIPVPQAPEGDERDIRRTLQDHIPYLCTQPCYFGGPFALNWGSDDRSPLDVSAASLERRMARRRIAPAFALPGYVAGAITQAFKRRADPDA
jgi:spermidine synthase